MNHNLATLSSQKLEEMYEELASYKELCDDDKDLRQDILDILYTRGWRI
jgi:hypothetical protein